MLRKTVLIAACALTAACSGGGSSSINTSSTPPPSSAGPASSESAGHGASAISNTVSASERASSASASTSTPGSDVSNASSMAQSAAASSSSMGAATGSLGTSAPPMGASSVVASTGASSSVVTASSGAEAPCAPANNGPSTALAFTVGQATAFSTCNRDPTGNNPPQYWFKANVRSAAGDVYRVFTTGLNAPNALDVDIEMGTNATVAAAPQLDPSVNWCGSANSRGQEEDCTTRPFDTAALALYVVVWPYNSGEQTAAFTVQKR